MTFVPADDADVYILSFPKCGRTWLRLLIVKALSLGFELPMELCRDLEPADFARAAPESLPVIAFLHDGDPGGRSPAEQNPDKSWYADRRVVFLTRDLRDVIVSHYFQRTRRQTHPYVGTLSEFLDEERGSLRSCIAYWNIWHAHRHTPSAFLDLSYERLTDDPAGELGRVLAFCGVPAVDPAVLEEAVRYAAFANMRAMEATGTLDSRRLRPGDPMDPESYKTRRGVVGGYRDYLTQDQIRFVNTVITENLTASRHPAAFAAGP
ncbi:sulfotransferase domain-containing protein [Embleya sp. NBC_00896]|uniref:sulfotransferase domain-containing protein n=1 Tax=Embleya sp. NBC_00896 TaxID=2975961 RepID=UPI002F915AA8|nr:sulfotransferase domain-containing protein [Embleya sp. NBC_00896]